METRVCCNRRKEERAKRKICHDRHINLWKKLIFCLAESFRYPKKFSFFSAESELKEKVKGSDIIVDIFCVLWLFVRQIAVVVIWIELEIGVLKR